jgi:hypothetical protein
VLDQPLDKGSFERLCFWLTWLGASLVFLCAVLSHIWNGFLYLLCQKTKVADLNFVRIVNVVDGQVTTHMGLFESTGTQAPAHEVNLISQFPCPQTT